MLTGSWLDFIWVGAEHMLTGYDHLLFLFGVVFFLRKFSSIVAFITAFTLGHVLVLLGATFAGVSANAHLIDAFIALTVVYKGFENLDGFSRWLAVKAPNLIYMVFLFGLVHGFGLSTQLQGLVLAEDSALVGKIVLFNVGVELGQIAALCVMVPVINAWRKTYVWEQLTRIANGLLIVLGCLLFLFQIHGYLHEQAASAPLDNQATSGWHRHGDGPLHRHN